MRPIAARQWIWEVDEVTGGPRDLWPLTGACVHYRWPVARGRHHHTEQWPEGGREFADWRVGPCQEEWDCRSDAALRHSHSLSVSVGRLKLPAHVRLNKIVLNAAEITCKHLQIFAQTCADVQRLWMYVLCEKLSGANADYLLCSLSRAWRHAWRTDHAHRVDAATFVKAAFHDTDTDILADSPVTPTSLRGSSRRCRCRCRCRGMRA